MKRSEINDYLIFAKKYLKKYCFELPPWAYWSPDDWAKAGCECNEIRKKMLGWDLTDFGSCDFEVIGLLMFTALNYFGTSHVPARRSCNERFGSRKDIIVKTTCRPTNPIKPDLINIRTFHSSFLMSLNIHPLNVPVGMTL